MGDHDDRDPSIRASDAERSETVERLKLAQQEGRLSIAEYDERLQKAYAAVVRADLDVLTADLPAVRGSDLPAARERRSAEAKREARSEMLGQWGSWAGTSVMLIGIWGMICVAAGELTFFWPMFPVGIWGLVLLTSSLRGDRTTGRGEIEE